MENSGQFLFKDDSVCWYVAQGEKWVGPMSATDLYDMLHQGKISWAHFVWKKGQSAWRRICEVQPFQGLAPSASKPKAKPKETTSQKSLPPLIQTRKWFLHYNDSQFGPFSQTEILRSLEIGKIHMRVYAWCQGMPNWQRMDSIPEFQNKSSMTQAQPPRFQKQKSHSESRSRNSSSVESDSESDSELNSGKRFSQKEERSDQRVSPRRPLVAKILLSNDQAVIIGVCRDISIGGMQVLADEMPVQVGTLIKMNVSPSTNETGPHIPPFVAEGKVVRLLEDGRGFSFRFTKLSDIAKKSIETYIESSD